MSDLSSSIAIIGMSGRFPGANTIPAFWELIRDGVEMVRPFTDDELLAAGEPLHPQRHEPNYVRARAVIERSTDFDAKFFGYPPREAEQMDPQQRVFLECSYEALEDAGYDPDRYDGAIGVFAGCYLDTYIFSNLCMQPGFLENLVVEMQVGALGPELANDKDHIATRVAFKLNLRGPAINVQTACSTSLVAVSQAVQSLLTYNCDMAIAGGATITFRRANGYLHQEGGMLASDGHCRAYDHRASGTVFGNGVAAVVLKRLEDAIRDRDTITAIIRSAALNNDGGSKVSYAAPSVEGQTDVIRLAHALADIDVSTIGLVEGHGTGTPLGDPIEVTALSNAFRTSTDAKQFCALGSLKPNIGHLDTASGVAGLIKASLALKHQTIPPLINFEKVNPEIDLENSPFYITTTARPWEKKQETPRRAAVSSFGVGGTNAHVILEEAPERVSTASKRPFQLLPLSAKSTWSLEQAQANLAKFLQENPETELADVAFTLQNGRRQFNQRSIAIASSSNEAAEMLTSRSSKYFLSASTEIKNSPVVFLFPGQGSQYVGMGRALYHHESVFRSEINRCAEILSPILGFDLRTILYADKPDHESATAQLTQTSITQPALFATEYALAKQWMAWGIQPSAMIGHSVGEYVAGCLSGVFSLEDGLALVATRAKLVQEMPVGGMLALRLSEEEVQPYVSDQINIAALNSSKLTVLAGPHEALDALITELAKQDIPARKLHTSHAFHSFMMEPIVGIFEKEVAKIKLNAPTIPYVSNVTGQWVTNEEATNPAYWAAHVRQAVRYADGITNFFVNPQQVLLEVGPGTTLQTLTRQHPDKPKDQKVFSSLPSPKEIEETEVSEEYLPILQTLGNLWLSGCSIHWNTLHENEEPYRISLPTYPFERKCYAIEPTPSSSPIIPSQNFISTTPALVQHKADAIHTINAVPVMSESRIPAIQTELKSLLYNLSGIELTDTDYNTSFLELGFDSLLLTQVRQSLQSALGLKVTFRQLMDDLSTLAQLTNYADANLPPEKFGSVQVHPSAPVSPSPVTAAPSISVSPLPGDTPVQQLINAQLQIMQQQLQALSGVASASTAPLAIPAATTPPLIAPQSSVKTESEKATAPTNIGPFKPANRGRTDGLTAHQTEYLNRLVRRYNKRTAQSKAYTQEHRSFFCDPRSAGNFRQLWKEMVYPIVCEKSKGSKIWDIDANEYIDITLGFGVHYLGHSPDYVMEAVQKQLEKGTEIGPQSPVAGEVAKLMTELTGFDRVTFCNTGSEAVMAAMRVARTFTARDKIVMFSGDYHGMFDDVLVHGFKVNDQWRTAPIAPGIPQGQVNDTIVLKLNDPESLDYIRQHAEEIAAVIVEPVQARNPSVHPREFLQTLREITHEHGIVYVFDEVITGFRCALGGAQEYFGVRADLGTYGKIVGGGIPIGVLAGKSEIMDHLDGGMWQYGDDSFPEIGVTFFAGTFIRHPLAMAAAHAVLTYLKKEGPQLQIRHAARADAMRERINKILDTYQVPAHLDGFGTLMNLNIDSHWEYGGLLYYYLRDLGIHIWEGRVVYISIQHSDEDVDRIVDAFGKAIQEMKEAHFLPTSQGGGDHPGKQPLNNNSDSPPIPTTPAQREIWLSNQISTKASLAFNESVSFFFEGELDVGVLTFALNEIVARHDALRAVFSGDGNSFHVKNALSVEVPESDLSDKTAHEREAVIHEIIKKEVETPFNLETGPLLRARLIRLSPAQFQLVFTAHHIVADGWSFNVISNELSILYNERIAGASSSLKKASQFSDYAKKLLESETSKAFWKEQFATIPPLLNLPTDRPYPKIRSFDAERYSTRIEGDFVQKIRNLSKSSGCTLFVTLLGFYQLLLSRLSGEKDIVTGIPAAGQSAIGEEDLIGHLVNLLPIRTPVDPDTPVSKFLQTVRNLVFDAYDHQDCTFGQIIPELNIPRIPGRIPLIEATLNLERMDRFQPFHHLKSRFSSNMGSSMGFYQFLNIVEEENALVFDWDYNTAILTKNTIERWFQSFCRLLKSATENADAPLRSLHLLTPQDEEELKVINQTQRAYPSDSTIHEIFAKTAAEHGEKLALQSEEKTFSYAELDEAITELANRISEFHIPKGAVIALEMERSAEIIIAQLAVLKSGNVCLPLDPKYPESRKKFILNDARPALSIDSALAISKTHDSPTILNQEAATLIYTSGTTGTPKSVVVSHRGILRLVCNNSFCELNDTTVTLHLSNPNFDASHFEVWGALLNGGTCVVQPQIIPTIEEIGNAIRNHHVTTLWITASYFNQIIDIHPEIFQPLQTLITGGEALSVEHVSRALEQLPNIQLINGYGPTESTTFTCCYTIPHHFDKQAPRVPIGTPIANTTVHILDPKTLQILPPGWIGELCIGGDGLATEYLGRPELTAEKFITHPVIGERLYRSGDLARLLPSGVFDCLGRIDNQVKLHGFRIEPDEIRTTLCRYPAITDSAVVIQKDDSNSASLFAYYIAENEISENELKQYLQAELPSYMIPSRLIRIDKIPLTANGKINLKALPIPNENNHIANTPNPPKTKVQEKLLKIWQEVLNRESIGIYDDFFELGGHSLLAAKVIAIVANEFGQDLHFSDFFEEATIYALALKLRDVSQPAKSASHNALTATIHPDGKGMPIFFLHGDLLGGGMYCKTLANEIGDNHPFHILHPLGTQGELVPVSVETMAVEALKVMREIQPEGPYIVGGYCNGALIAHQIGIFLQKQHIPVAAILLVADDSSIGYETLLRIKGMQSAILGENEFEKRERFLKARDTKHNRRALIHYYRIAFEELLKQPFNKQITRVCSKLKRVFRRGRSQEIRPSTPIVQRDPLVDTYDDICRAYVPNSSSVKTILLWPTEEPAAFGKTPAQSWGRVCSDLKVIDIPGNHDTSIAVTENVCHIGQVILQSIKEIESTDFGKI